MTLIGFMRRRRRRREERAPRLFSDEEVAAQEMQRQRLYRAAMQAPPDLREQVRQLNEMQACWTEYYGFRAQARRQIVAENAAIAREVANRVRL